MKNFYAVEEINQNYDRYLGTYLNLIMRIRQCPVNKMRLCITSDPEWEKCIKMMVSSRSFCCLPWQINFRITD